jgi:hypothetical protein
MEKKAAAPACGTPSCHPPHADFPEETIHLGTGHEQVQLQYYLVKFV